MGVATCDKGLPAMLLALAGQLELSTILVPGGVTLPPTHGEDAGKVQTLGVRYAQGEITLEDAADLRIEPTHEGRRGRAGRPQAPPVRAGVARYARLGDGGQIGSERRALLGGDGQRT